MMNLPSDFHHSLKSPIAHFIVDNSWAIPSPLDACCPTLVSEIKQVTVPNFSIEDQLVWNLSADGNLSFKGAYLLCKPIQQSFAWGKFIWNQFIPSSRSFMVWRLFHTKVPTDDNLRARGCICVSMCSLYESSCETSDHLFFDCQYASLIWSWLESSLNVPIDHSSLQNLFLSITETGALN